MYDPQALINIMKFAVEKGASDIHITVGRPPMLRINGVLNPIPGQAVCEEKDTFTMLNTIMDTKRRTQFFDDGETDFSYELPGFSRFRVNIYKQSGCVSGALRLISSEIPTLNSCICRMSSAI
jgi:twitching motility protein PilT